MSRAYQPILPAASRYLQEKWDKAAYRQHRNKVDSASPAVDTQGLQPPSHLQLNLKRRQLDRERQAIRERDDRIHSARLVAIAQSRGRLDNWNSYSVRRSVPLAGHGAGIKSWEWLGGQDPRDKGTPEWRGASQFPHPVTSSQPLPWVCLDKEAAHEPGLAAGAN
ncbi:unnamed protein product [Lepidochelys olivacea]